MKLAEVLKFIKKHNLAVLATTDKKGKPQAAVVEFAELDNFTIIIDTFDHSRKYMNLNDNDKAAIFIGWDNNKTVQIDGQAKELSGAELKKAQDVYFAKNPRARKWGTKPGIVYFAIEPSWMRYSDLNEHPWLVEEFNL